MTLTHPERHRGADDVHLVLAPPPLDVAAISGTHVGVVVTRTVPQLLRGGWHAMTWNDMMLHRPSSCALGPNFGLRSDPQSNGTELGSTRVGAVVTCMVPQLLQM